MNMKHTHESGRSMIEMLGVLAIIGVLSVGGIQGYSMAMSKFKVSKTTDQVQTMVTNVRTLFAGNRTYDGLGDTTSGYGTAYTLGIFNDEICDDKTCKNPVNPYGGSVSIGTANKKQYFTISYSGLPQDACTRLAMADWGDASSGLVAIIASGAAATAQTNSTSFTANAAGGIFTTTAHLIPISLSNAVTACKLTASADNSSSITWIYR